jgi:ribosomal protein S18 acetylase RimI-like enzyme
VVRDDNPSELAMLVRSAELRDVEPLKALRHAAFAKHAPSRYSPVEVENLLKSLDEEELVAMIAERQLFVGEVDGLPVVCASWRGTNLRHVYVRPGCERAGLGSRLVACAEADYRNRTSAAYASVCDASLTGRQPAQVARRS